MKTVLSVVGVVLVLLGGLWILQGVNVLPGSFMSGQRQWAINGAIAVVAGALLIGWARRRWP